MDKTNLHILADLYGTPGFEFVDRQIVVDNQQKRKYVYKIKFDAPAKGWLVDPPPKKTYSSGDLKEPDSFGTWDELKRPTTDRFFVPKEIQDEDSSSSFLTGPPSVCAEGSKLKALLDSKPLVRNHENKKCLFLPDPMFTPKCLV